jgi:membrane protein
LQSREPRRYDRCWRDVWVGALITAVLFTVGRFAFGFYLGSMKAESAFGASAWLIAVLVWVYYSAQIVFMGAEFTQVYSRRFGSHAGEARVPAASESRARQAAARPAPFSKTEVTISALTLALAGYRQRRASAGLIRRSALCV